MRVMLMQIFTLYMGNSGRTIGFCIPDIGDILFDVPTPRSMEGEPSLYNYRNARILFSLKPTPGSEATVLNVIIGNCTNVLC